MDYKKLGFGLGLFSLALGAAELFASERIARALDVEGHEGVIQAFGAREVVAGLGLVAAPANASGVWNRVAGDGMDLAALATVVARSDRVRRRRDGTGRVRRARTGSDHRQDVSGRQLGRIAS
jgi:hypothetical protein